jgi:hypothetical protein
MIRSQGRRLQSRRATSFMIWISLVLLAFLLWRARSSGQVPNTIWEPAVLVLSAFTTFLSLFGWLLFWPQRSSGEESPLLFLAGLLTLIPPCVIAWLMMPPGAVLRPWLSMAVLIFGILTILSPIPAELFRVPRDRRHWLQLVTDASLSMIDVDAPQVSFENVLPQTQFRLTRSAEQSRPAAAVSEPAPAMDEPTRDPWEDPFRGTGRRLSRVRDAATPSGAAASASVSGAPTNSVAAAVQPPPVPVPRALLQQFPDTPIPGAPTTSDVRQLDRSIREEERRGSMENESAPTEADNDSDGGLISEIVSIERNEDEFGGVMVEGIARASFRTGQKRLNLQIPLSPPLPGVPEAECEPTGHEPLRARVALRQPYGLRIEVRRSESSQPLEAEISFSAVYTPSRPG